MEINNLPKDLTKLVKFCRKYGIKNFKSETFEFTLTDNDPTIKLKAEAKSTKTRRKLAMPNDPLAYVAPDNDDIPSESLSDEALLFWSVNTPEEKSEQ